MSQKPEIRSEKVCWSSGIAFGRGLHNVLYLSFVFCLFIYLFYFVFDILFIFLYFVFRQHNVLYYNIVCVYVTYTYMHIYVVYIIV